MKPCATGAVRALPYPRSFPTRPVIPAASGEEPGSIGRYLSSRQRIHSASRQKPLVRPSAPCCPRSFRSRSRSPFALCILCDASPVLPDPPVRNCEHSESAIPIPALSSSQDCKNSPPRCCRSLLVPVRFGVGHEVQSLSDVRRAEARRANIDTPNGVCRCFQVSRNSAEPSEAVFARNLLTKDYSRRTLPDEVIKRGP